MNGEESEAQALPGEPAVVAAERIHAPGFETYGTRKLEVAEV